MSCTVGVLAVPTESHVLMNGALHIYRRENSRFWQCATYLSRRNYRQTTKERAGRTQSEARTRWACPHLLELATHLYLPAVARRRRHLSGRQNCRTSVEMIEKFYAQRLQNNVDASAVNVRRTERRKSSESDGRGLVRDASRLREAPPSL